MLDFKQIKFNQIIVHSIGNKVREEGFKLSKSALKIEETIIQELLQKYFLSPFKNNEYYNLHHESDVALNEMYAYASKIFADPDALYLQSINIAKHLYEKSSHPKIKGGEFYIAYFQDCIVDNDVVDAIGLFKSENKDTYLKVFAKSDNYQVNYDEGININKLDKGCLIFNTEKEKGFKVCIVDSLNKSGEAQYWKDEFLKLKPREDSFHHTQNYLKLCQGFVEEKLREDFEVSKADEIHLMNNSVKYFREKEVFDINEFSNEIIRQPELVDAFREYKDQYQQERNIRIYDEFDISRNALKNQGRVFKSVIKLDKNFHVYVHGNRDCIVKGYDEERGMHFYQLFFRQEE